MYLLSQSFMCVHWGMLFMCSGEYSLWICNIPCFQGNAIIPLCTEIHVHIESHEI